MDQTILLLIIGGASGIGGLLIGRFAFAKNTKKQVEDAENQAASILKEAELRAETIKKEKQLEAKERFVQLKADHDRELLEKNKKIGEAENRIKQHELSINQKAVVLDKQINDNEAIKEKLNREIDLVNIKRGELEKHQEEHIRRLEKIANLTAEDAKQQLIESLKNEAQSQALALQQDIIELKKTVAGTNIIILSDEVYEHLIFEGKQHQSILKHPDLLTRSYVCFSFGKTMHCTGWKLGYCVSGPELMQEYRKVHQFNAFTCDTPKQVALAAYLNENKNYEQLGQQMQQKRDLLRQLLSQTKFEHIPSYGSYFECYSYKNISNENDKDFAIRLTKDFGLATIPVSAFYQDKTDYGVIRFCFAKKDETLMAAAEKLKGL